MKNAKNKALEKAKGGKSSYERSHRAFMRATENKSPGEPGTRKAVNLGEAVNRPGVSKSAKQFYEELGTEKGHARFAKHMNKKYGKGTFRV